MEPSKVTELREFRMELTRSEAFPVAADEENIFPES